MSSHSFKVFATIPCASNINILFRSLSILIRQCIVESCRKISNISPEILARHPLHGEFLWRHTYVLLVFSARTWWRYYEQRVSSFFRAWRWITLLQSTCSFIRCTQCSQHYCIPHVLHSIVFTVVTPSLCVFIRRRPACFSPKLHYQIVCAFQWKMNFIRRTRKKCDLVSRTSWLAAICRARFRSIENLIIIGLLSLLHSYLS